MDVDHAEHEEQIPALADLLRQVEQFLCRYVVYQSTHQPVACVLWTAHTWAFEAFDVSPFLHVTSPEKRSGKTRLLEALELLVRSPWRVISPSEAVLYRKVDSAHPTLLLDEADTIFRDKHGTYEPLRALLNAGNRKGVHVPRCVGEGRNVPLKDFDVFSPRVIAGIGRLPDTVEDRAIPIRLQRRSRQETVTAFRFRQAAIESRLIRESLAGWAPAAIPLLQDARPEVPASLHDRAAELWEVLLSIADLAGASWPNRARKAAIALHGDDLLFGDDTLGVCFRRAIRAVFDDRQAQEIPTVDLLKALMERDDTPAAEWWSRALKDDDTRGPGRKLANILRQYDNDKGVPIASGDIRTPEGIRKGYRRGEFEDACARYLSCSPPRSPENRGVHATDATPLGNQGMAGDSHDATADATQSLTQPIQPLQDTACRVVASTADPLENDWTSLRALAESQGWPRVYTGRGETVLAGPDAWARYLRTATNDQIQRALAALQALEGAGATP